MSRIQIHNLTKLYDDTVTALDDVTLDCDAGRVVALVGPSGCGKTTLLRCIAGLETPDSGSIQIGDRDVTTVDPRDRGIAMVFQNYALYPTKTVRDNIAFPLRMAGIPEPQRRQRVEGVAAMLRIDELLERKPAALSGGQRQRVGIGRALVREPTVLAMDEPLSNLDAELRVQMRAELLELQRRLGITTVYVTHDLTEALTLGDQLVVLRDGRVQQTGTPEDVFDRPATIEVASFLGGMNLLRATAASGTLFISDQLKVPLPDELGQVDGPVSLGFRPEQARVGTDDAGLRLRGDIMLDELQGAERVLHLRVAGEGPTVRVRVPAHIRTAEGLTVHWSDVHLFDDVGKRLPRTITQPTTR